MNGRSSIRQRIRPIVLSILASAAVAACSEQSAPTASELALDGAASVAGRDSGQQGPPHQEGRLAIHGRVLRFSGEPRDTIPNDTLGTPVPVAGALVEAYFVGPFQPDTGDSVIVPPPPPPDSGDTIRPPVDSSGPGGDSLMFDARSFGLRVAADTGGGIPKDRGRVAFDRTDGQGAYTLSGLVPGFYRVELTLAGESSARAWTIVAVRYGDTYAHPFLLPPQR